MGQRPVWKQRLGAVGAALALSAFAPSSAASQSGPSLMLPGAVSGEMNDYNPSLSADQQTMVFARSEAAFDQARIMLSERPGPETGWSVPRPIDFTDERYRDSDPWLTPDGRTLYFVSDRPTAGRGDRRDLDIWRSQRRAGRWQAPEHLGDVVNRSGEELGPEVHNGLLYFATALRSGVGGLDIYAASLAANGYAEPRLLPAPINSSDSESDFTLSADGGTALFWRTVNGRGLIHLAQRSADGDWSNPEPLPDSVNIGGFNFTPAFAPDGNSITFASNLQRSGQQAGMADIYQAPLPYSVSPAPWDPQARISEAVAIVRRKALRSDVVDWTGLEAELRASASSAADTVDMLPLYRRLLTALGDSHSFVQVEQPLRERYTARYGAEFDAVAGSGRPASRFIGRREPSSDLIILDGTNHKIALVTVPKVFGGGARASAYANALYDGVVAAAPAACAYILDLRGNVGGNVWPMKLGLTALLGEDYDQNDSYARVRNGAVTIVAEEDAGLELVRLDRWRPLPHLQETPVAVLIDSATASSGEGVALAFKGRDQTRFFGQNTAGLASVNEGFELRDGVNLVVTVEMMTDRNGAVYPNGIAPDLFIGAGEGSAGDGEDAVRDAAKLWLTGLPTCGS